MRINEVELIAALAEGRLEDETAARALIDSSPKYRAEYEAQKTAYEALDSIPPAQLTEHETAAIHRDIWTELQARPLSAATKTPWYYRWSYAAAGLFLVVGLVVVVDQTNPNFVPTALLGSDNSGTETFAESSTGQSDATDTTSAEGAAPAITESAAADAAADEEAAGGDAGPGVAGGDDGVALYAAPDVTGLSELAKQTRTGELELMDQVASDLDRSIVDDMAACIQSAGLVDHDVVGDVELENHYIVAVPAGVDPGPDTPISFVDADRCELILTVG